MKEQTQGPNYEDACPISGDAHRYFISKTLEVFEPALPITGLSGSVKDFIREYHPYIKKEYAILGCNCGSALKKEVEKI